MLWGVLLLPTFLLWTSFLGLMLAVTRNRAAVYGIGLAALIATIYFQFKGDMSWPFNWWLFNPEPWTDLGAFQYNRVAILLNRVEMLGFALLFTWLAVRFFPRREDDATRVLHGLRPLPLLKSALRLVPAAIVPIGLALTLGMMVRSGPGGKAMEKTASYWRRTFRPQGCEAARQTPRGD